MGRQFTVVFFILSISFTSSSQQQVALRAAQLFQYSTPETIELFAPGKDSDEEDMQDYLRQSVALRLQHSAFQDILSHPEELLQIRLPHPLNSTLDVYRSEVFAQEAKVLTSDGRQLTRNPHHYFYRGMIRGNLHSLVVMSILEDHVIILISDETGNKRIQPSPSGEYIYFEDKDLVAEKYVSCHVPDEGLDGMEDPKPTQSESRVTGNCVQVYVECDYESYLDNNSNVGQTEDWVATLWNEVAALYENEDIPVQVSDIYVYTSPDPFMGYSGTLDILYAFTDHIGDIDYDGRLAHLLSTRNLGGGIAWINVLCSGSNQTAFSSSLSTSITPVPTYSWNVEVVTHEMGHNMGSHHTHACVWNGNNTQIDDCGNVYADDTNNPIEGASCYNPSGPIVPASGTIMSYCHLLSGVGISFANGFGTQPGNLIRNKFETAWCVTGDCEPPSCVALLQPVAGSNNVEVSTHLDWPRAYGATGFKLTVGTSPTNGNIVNNLDLGPVSFYDFASNLPFNTTIYVKIIPYNMLGEATGCSNQTFTTEPNTTPSCTAMNQPANGADGVSVHALISWPHSVGNQGGYKVSIGTSPGGTNIANQVNVGNTNVYDHSTAFPYATTLYVRVTPYDLSNNEIGGCANHSFTTIVPIDGDFCSSAFELSCGASIQGSTMLALPDTSGMPYCVTSIEAPGVWYKFTGDGANAIISTCSQYDFDTKLNVYKGDCNNLVCVTGIDDFCGQGAQVSFPTTSGTTYYILVQGWNGEQGDFTITRSCYTGPFYCQQSGLYPTLEWIKTVTLGTFSKTSTATHYSNFLSDTITVTRGASAYNLTLTPMYLQSSRPVYFRVWADLNRDGDFADTGETLYSAGPVTAATTGTFTIPVTSSAGVTRLRVAMRHNAAPTHCTIFMNGEVEDYSLRIKCNLVTTNADSGNGSLRTVSACADDGEDILFAPSLNNQTITISNPPLSVDGIWKWMPAANSNITIKAASNATRVISIPSGKSLEIQHLKLVGGTAATGSVMENAGSLVMRDCQVYRLPSSANPPVRNIGAGTILWQGNNAIRL